VRHDSGEWDSDKFRDYVLAAAGRLRMERPAAIARAADVTPSQLSKWLRGLEQPSVKNLQKLADGLKVPRRDLFSLAGRFSDEDLQLDGTPEIPGLAHPLAQEVDAMLADTSPLGEERRASLNTVLDAVLASYRGDMKRRRMA
jgi:transcriptional regulator with XRE-family HTH domain